MGAVMSMASRSLIFLIGLTIGVWFPLILTDLGWSNFIRRDDVFLQRNFPCNEDEALAFAPKFGPDKVGCIQVDDKFVDWPSIFRNGDATILVRPDSTIDYWCGPSALACLAFTGMSACNTSACATSWGEPDTRGRR